MLKRLIPSMFHRRLALLFAITAIASALMLVQSRRLTIVQGAQWLEAAERNTLRSEWVPTVRGSIVDRKGRVLSRDIPAFDVRIPFRVLSREWAVSEAARAAREADPKTWDRRNAQERGVIIDELEPRYAAQIDAMWQELAHALGEPVTALEDRRAEIVARVQQMASTLAVHWQRQRSAELNRDRETRVEVELGDVVQRIREQDDDHAIAIGVSEEVASAVRRVQSRYPRMEIVVEGGAYRQYPFESVTVNIDTATFPSPMRPPAGSNTPAPVRSVTVNGVDTHILGWLRTGLAEDINARPAYDRATRAVIDRGGYLEADLVGAWGIERTFEKWLRGFRGRRVRHLDTGVVEDTAAEHGQDIELSIDIMLQARVMAIMDPSIGLAQYQPWQKHPKPDQALKVDFGTPFNGAAVVLDVDSGEVLAMVSTPGFTRADLTERPDAVWKDDLNAPWVNKAINKPYPPGSIVKPLMLCAAVTDREFDLSQSVECKGHLLPDQPGLFRCWIWKQNNFAMVHGPLRAPEALARSCNIFFYTLAQRLGPEKVAAWYRKFGVGEAPRLGAGEEYPGVAGGSGGKLPEYGEAILMGIGQGPIAWTPMHAADAYATLARGGLRLSPRLVRTVQPRATDLKLDPDAVDHAKEGLRLSVSERFGSGHHISFEGKEENIFNCEGVQVWGKTGTAEAPDLFSRDPDGEGPLQRRLLRAGDHSWFVVLCAPEGMPPRYAIAVIMEYAGSGGRVSGPICNQIIHALRAEGYL